MSSDELDNFIQDFERDLKRFNIDQEVIDSFSQALETGGYASGVVTEAIREEIQARAKSAQQEEDLRPIREALIEKERQLVKAAEEARRQLEFDQSVRKEVIKITQKAAGSFLTATEKIRSDAEIGLAFASDKNNAQFSASVTAAETAFRGSKLTAGVKAEDLPEAQAFQDQVKTFLKFAKDRGIGDEVAFGRDNARIEYLIEEASRLEEKAEGARKSGIESLRKQLEALNTTNTGLAKDQKEQVEKSKEMVKAQVAAAKQAQRLRAGGGVGAIGNPAAMNDIINRLRASSISGGIASRIGSASGMDSATVNRAKAIQDLVGGDLAETNPALAKKAREAAFRDRFRSLQAVNLTLAPGERMSQQFIKDAAREQANNLFKGGPIEQQTKATEKLTETMDEFRKAMLEGRAKVADKEREATEFGVAARDFDAANQRNILRNTNRQFAYLDQQDLGLDMEAQGRQELRNAFYESTIASSAGVPGLIYNLTQTPDKIKAAQDNIRGGRDIVEGGPGEKGARQRFREAGEYREATSTGTNIYLNGLKVAASDAEKEVLASLADKGIKTSTRGHKEAEARYRRGIK